MTSPTRSIALFLLAAALGLGVPAAQAQTVVTVTNTNASGPGSLTGVLASLSAACPAQGANVLFNIPASTDPGCNAATGVCSVQIPDLLHITCNDTVIDGYSQPGASPNTATDFTNNAQIKIELDNASADVTKAVQVHGPPHPFGTFPIERVTIRGLAFLRHVLQLMPPNTGSIVGGVNAFHVVAGNYFGTYADGTIVTGVASRGLLAYGGLMHGVRVGGPLPADRNLFNYRLPTCCETLPPAITFQGVDYSLVENNFINVGRDGQPVVSNGFGNGVLLNSANGGTPEASFVVVRDNVIFNTVSTFIGRGAGAGITLTRNLTRGRPVVQAWNAGIGTQQAPVLTGVTASAGELLVFGTVTSGADRTVRLEFFHNTQPYPVGIAKSERFVGQLDVTVDGSGNGSFVASLPPDTLNVAVSATNLTSGETSELNTGAQPPQVFPLNLTRAGAGLGTVTGGNGLVNCTGTCTIALAKDSIVTLTATAQPGSAFSGWSGDCSGTAPCTVTMNDIRNVTANYIGGSGPPVIGNAPLSTDVTGGVFYAFNYQVTGAIPFTWSLEPDCALPMGLALDAVTGTLSGIPSNASERFNCTVRVSNGIAPDALQDYEIRANILPGTPVFTSPSTLPSGTTGVIYPAMVGVQGTAPITVQLSAGSLPPGLTLLPDGAFTGAPTVVGTFNFTLRASGPDGAASKPFRISIDQGIAPQITSAAPAGATQFVAYTHTFAATGTVPIAWSVISGALPAGLTLGGATGVLSGTATVSGNFTFTVQAANGTLPNATQDVTLVIANNARTLNVTRSGAGTGTVTTAPAGINCGTTCSAQFQTGSSVTLTATPDANNQFAGWTNACTGTQPTCTTTMNSTKTVNAIFQPVKFTVTVTRVGSGFVSSVPAGIGCGSACESDFNAGSTVTLTAGPSINFIFAGWSGACTGTGDCVLTMDAAKAVTATFTRLRDLTVTRAGGGTGTVTSTPAGIACGATCTAAFLDGSVVQLAATPGAGSVFTGWSGACTGTGACSVTMSAAQAVTATFDTAPSTLTVATAGTGTGLVTSIPAGINCGTACAQSFADGTTVTLSATASLGSSFAGWSGACTGTGACVVVMNAARSVTATFTLNPQLFALTLTKAGTGAGQVTSTPAGIACGSNCAAPFAVGTTVTLVAAPSAGSNFSGWTGACSGADPQCTVTMDAAKAVTATFTRIRFTLTARPLSQLGGTIVSSPPGLSCTASFNLPQAPTCTGDFDSGTTVTLTALPAGSFGGWTGPCTPSGNTCTLNLTAPVSVNANFAGDSRPIIVSKPLGPGTITAVTTGGVQVVNCGPGPAPCTSFVHSTDTLTFSATPAPDHVFMGWTLTRNSPGGTPGFIYDIPGCRQLSTTCVLPMNDQTLVMFSAQGTKLAADFVKIPSSVAGLALATAPALARSARVGASSFQPSPAVDVRDAQGAPVPGAFVRWDVITGPSGASQGRFGFIGGPGTTRTSASGVASVPTSANGIVGTWTMRATVSPGNLAPIDFVMSNTNDTVPVTLPGTGRVTIPTSSDVGVRLSVLVRRPNQAPIAGAIVRFSAPASPNSFGNVVPSGSLSPAIVTTGSSGIARSLLTSNGVRGTFVVTVNVTIPLGASASLTSGNAGEEEYTSELLVETADAGNPLADDPAGDFDGDGIPNAVEDAEGTLLLDKDNDVFENARLFSMQQYRDFLGREGDAGGITSWENYLNGGGARAAVTEGFFGSPEFQGTGSPVVRLYFAYFLRIPDYGGLTFWMNYFRSGHSLVEISNAFAGSQEFTDRYGALTNAAFVDLVYQNVLGRPADAGGKAFWLGQLNGGMSRGQMMLGFSESPEYQSTIFSDTYVTMMYVGMLKREPDNGGFSFWTNYLDTGNSGQALINGFLAAPEYRARFLP